MDFVKVTLVNGRPTVTVTEGQKFDDEAFLASLEEIKNQYKFNSSSDRNDFMSILCGAFGYPTDKIDPLLPIMEVGKQLVEETKKEDRILKTEADLGSTTFESVTKDDDGSDDSSSGSDAIDALFLNPLAKKERKKDSKQSASSIDEDPDDNFDGEDGVE